MKIKSKMILLCIVLAAICIIIPTQDKARTYASSIPKKLLVDVGKTQKIKLNNRAGHSYRFILDNKKIASVSSKGVVRGKKKGVTHLSVYRNNGTSMGRIRICVISKVKSIKFRTKSKSCYEGEKVTLKPKIAPDNANDKRLKWKSSNTSIATVSSKGVVKAKKKGIVTITAYSVDGSKKKGSYQLKVRKRVSSILIENGVQEIGVHRGDNRKLKYTVSPADADNRGVNWNSSNTKVATIGKYGEIKAISNGQTIITAVSKDGSKVEATIVVDVFTLSKSDVAFVAHRGVASQAPENTLAAFQLACDYGFWGAECDIYRTKDNQFVVSHDQNLQRMCRVDLNISDLTLQEVKQYPVVEGANADKYSIQMMPSLEEYLQLLSRYSGMHAVIEIKQDSITVEDAQNIVDLINQYGMGQRTIIISTSQDNLQNIKSVDVSQQISCQLIVKKLDNLTKAMSDNNIGVSCYYKLLPSIIQMGFDPSNVGVWTVNDRNVAYEATKINKCQYVTTEDILFDE